MDKVKAIVKDGQNIGKGPVIHVSDYLGSVAHVSNGVCESISINTSIAEPQSLSGFLIRAHLIIEKVAG